MTGVTRTASWLTAIGVAVGLLAASPAAVADPLGSLPGLLAPTPEPPASTDDTARAATYYGRTGAADGTLRRGCHNYAYAYRVTVPSEDWVLETFLRDPTGETIASGAFLSDHDARRERSVFRFCRNSTRPGAFTVTARVTWYDDRGTEHADRLQPKRFVLKRVR